MNEFANDDHWQKDKRDRILRPWYERISDGFGFMEQGEMATLETRRSTTDTIIVSRKTGNVLRLEEKIVRWPGFAYAAYTLETMSCTLPGKESPGWMVTCTANILNYAFGQPDEDVLLVHVLDFPLLKDWFWTVEDTFPKTTTNQWNRTLCRVVDFAAIPEGITKWKGFVRAA